jgi:glyoxylase-like metal-dependent hydrolase (beta-lactamase superfamily II)
MRPEEDRPVPLTIRTLVPATLACLLALAPWDRAAAQSRGEPLRLQEYVADSQSFHVVSVIVYGPTEAILVDAQNRPADGRAVAERIAATGRRLKAIVITHPDHDHYTGLAAVLERFPGTPVYMTPAAIAEYDRTKPDAARLALMRARMPAGTVPDSMVTARPLPGNTLTVDGQSIAVTPDLQGDVEAATNSVLWIPSIGTLIAGDVVFNGVHPWLGASTPATRDAWRRALDQLSAMHPRVVVAGHKPGESTADTPDAIAFTRGYLEAFDAERARASSPDQVIAAMSQRYAGTAVAVLLNAGGRMTLRAPGGGPTGTPPAASPLPPGAFDLSGIWSGSLEVPGQQIVLEVSLSRGPSGYSGDAGPQGAPPAPLNAVQVEGSHVVMTFAASSGEARIDGTLSADQRAISGSFSLGARTVPLTLARRP